MEVLLISSGVAVTVIVLVRKAIAPRHPPKTSRECLDDKPPRLDIGAIHSRATAGKVPRPKVQPRPGRNGTPTPAGARAEMSPKARRALQLVEEVKTNGHGRLVGKAWVIDGDTIVIDSIHIRLAGIDAPELDQPFGQKSKWALVRLCRGRQVTATIRPELSYDRVVAECRLEDGTDLAEALVREGLALDWPHFSDGCYARFEPAGVRRRLWRTAIRQRA